MPEKQGNMMQNRGKTNEKWWAREKKTIKNDEKKWKRQWNMMKKRGKTRKHDEK